MNIIYFCLHSLFSSDAEEEGTYRNYYNGEIVDLGFGIANSVLNGGKTENCALFVPVWNGWQDWSCIINAAQPITCACEHPHQMYLQLRGLCPSSTIDQFYVPRNKKRVGSVILIGNPKVSLKDITQLKFQDSKTQSLSMRKAVCCGK